jgi:hypothetical protein
MSEAHKTINLTWRDENYGEISGAVAFRANITPYPSETTKRKIATAYKAAGFDLHFKRQSWVARQSTEAAPLALIENLEAMGYEVANNGCIPAALETEPTPAQVSVARLKP